MIIETGQQNYSAYLPDLPGCVATGKTIEEVRERMRAAIELHIAGMREDGLQIPEPTSLADYIEAA
jgi:predicted RNase H-like HicB family nuclease